MVVLWVTFLKILPVEEYLMPMKKLVLALSVLLLAIFVFATVDCTYCATINESSNCTASQDKLFSTLDQGTPAPPSPCGPGSGGGQGPGNPS